MRSALLLCLLALVGCAGPALDGFAAAAQAEQARRPADYVNGEARAFIVSRDGRQRGLLWGTMHVGYDNATALPRPLRARFAAARDLHVESVVDRLSDADLARLGQAQQAQSRYDPAAIARLDEATRAALARVTLPDGSAPRASLRSLSRLVGAGPGGPDLLPAGDIVDVQLIGFARVLGVEVAGLDATPAAPASDPNSAAAAGKLREAVRRQAAAPRFADWLRRAYARGQVADVTAALVGWRSEAADLAREDAARPALFAQRNAAWVPVLERSLAEPGFHVAAFGAGHLIGADGVVALLRARGWTVAPCIADLCPPP